MFYFYCMIMVLSRMKLKHIRLFMCLYMHLVWYHTYANERFYVVIWIKRIFLFCLLFYTKRNFFFNVTLNIGIPKGTRKYITLFHCPVISKSFSITLEASITNGVSRFKDEFQERKLIFLIIFFETFPSSF